MISNVFLSEAIATRLSHDLIGNIGAVSNAVELLKEEESFEESTDILKILQFSSDVLGKRLKFFRLCFGLSNAAVKTVDEMRQIIADYFSTLGNPNTATTLSLSVETPKVYKLVMPAVMLMADTLVKGGNIAVTQNDSGIHIEAQSSATLNDTKLKNIDAIIDGQDIDENPSTYAPLYYLLCYLNDGAVPVIRKNNMLIIGE